VSHSTDWFMRTRWGVNIAFMGRNDESADVWNRRVDAFNVDGLASQLGSVRVPYCFLTIGQNSGHYCSPNSTYDNIVGIRPSKCSRRDLVADLAAALSKHGIRLLVYLPSGAPTMEPLACERLEWEWGYETPWPNGYCDNIRTGKRLEDFQSKWEKIITEWSLRWSRQVSGWWIDGCYFAEEMYRHPKAPNFRSFTAALRSGNPEALVAFNPGQIVPVISHSEHEDYTTGEISENFPLCPGRWVERNKHAAQWHVYTWIGQTWGGGTVPRLPSDFVIGYTRHAAEHQGVVTWDVPFQNNGLIQEPYMQILDALTTAVPPVHAATD